MKIRLAFIWVTEWMFVVPMKIWFSGHTIIFSVLPRDIWSPKMTLHFHSYYPFIHAFLTSSCWTFCINSFSHPHPGICIPYVNLQIFRRIAEMTKSQTTYRRHYMLNYINIGMYVTSSWAEGFWHFTCFLWLVTDALGQRHHCIWIDLINNLVGRTFIYCPPSNEL